MEFEVMAKDYIRFYFLKETVHTKTTELYLYVESEDYEKNFLEVRKDTGVYRVNHFNVSEDMSNNTVTFRPIVIGSYSYFNIKSVTPVRVEVILNGTNTVSRHFVLGVGESRLIFEPQETKRYNVRVDESNIQRDSEPAQWKTNSVPFSDNASTVNHQMGVQETNSNPSEYHEVSDRLSGYHQMNCNLTNDNLSEYHQMNCNLTNDNQVSMAEAEKQRELKDSISGLNDEIAEISAELETLTEKNNRLIENKKSLMNQLERLKTEYEKDYSDYERDMEEIKARYQIDKEIMRYYAGENVEPVEVLLAQANEAVMKLEEQIRIFVLAKQKKTAEIENELKIGKKD